MKISDKQLKMLFAGFCLLGGLVGGYTSYYNKNHVSAPNHYGKWIAVTLFLVAMLFLAPWNKKENQAQ